MNATPPAPASVRTHVLTLSCQDRPRIVASVTAMLADAGANIAESAQFWDRSINRFFMRIAFQAPAEVSSAALGTAILPQVSRFVGAGEPEQAAKVQGQAAELAMLLCLPAAVALAVSAGPLVAALFQGGHFTTEDARLSALTLSIIVLGLPAYVLVKVLTPGFYARADTKTPVRLAIYSVGINLVGNLILIPTLGRFGVGHVGPPLATALASCVNTWMLYRTLRARGHFEADRQLKRRIPRLALAALIMGGLLFFLAPYADPWLTQSLIVRFLALAVLVGGGIAVYGLACFATGAFALDDLKTLLRRRARLAETKD